MPLYHHDYPRTYLSRKDLFLVYDLRHAAEEAAASWEMHTIEGCIQSVQAYHTVEFITSYENPGMGKVFWQALLYGGRQGALYLLDSLYEASSLVDIETILNGIVCGNR
jgi:hypothetical protein